MISPAKTKRTKKLNDGGQKWIDTHPGCAAVATLDGGGQNLADTHPGAASTTNLNGLGHNLTDAQKKIAQADTLNGRGQNVIDAQCTAAASGNSIDGGHCSLDTHLHGAPVDDLCVLLKELQAQRVAVVRMVLRINNQAGALVRRFLGWSLDKPEKERAAIAKASAAAIKKIESGEIPDGFESVAVFVLTSQESCKPFDRIKSSLEKQMQAAAKKLPAYQWCDSIRGFGALGLAIIVGECGNLSNYDNPSKLWKRCGLAPNDCYYMITKSGAEAFAKPKRRRSAIFTIGDSLIKGNRNDGELLTYCKVYADRKAYELARNDEMSKMHAHRRAQRYMEKRLLRDLWNEWRKHQ